MEIIFIVLAFSIMQYFMYCEVRKVYARLETISEYHERKYDSIEMQLSSIRRHIDEVNISLVAFNAEQRRSLVAFKDSLEPTRPIKPNNWDSVREAFKGPVRVEINERN